MSRSIISLCNLTSLTNRLITFHSIPIVLAAKINFPSYFRHLPIDPFDWPLLVSVWDFGEGMEPLIDTRMPFGLRHAPEVCCRFSSVVMYAVIKKVRAEGWVMGRDVLIANVVDDWLIMAVQHKACEFVWLLLRALLKSLGFTVNEKPHKLAPPARLMR